MAIIDRSRVPAQAHPRLGHEPAYVAVLHDGTAQEIREATLYWAPQLGMEPAAFAARHGIIWAEVEAVAKQERKANVSG